MGILELLGSVEIFDGLNQEELKLVETLCYRRTFQENQVIARQNSYGDELYIIQEGFVEVSVESRGGRKVIVNLGRGQTVGEMSLIDQGRRSATVVARSSPTEVLVILQEDFDNLCRTNGHIGYIVVRNIATDLSFRLRQRNLNDMIQG